MQKPFQRVGDKSNGQVGREFEFVAQAFFANQGVELMRGHKLQIGIGERKKFHSFDLGCVEKKMDRGMQVAQMDGGKYHSKCQDERVERGHVLLPHCAARI